MISLARATSNSLSFRFFVFFRYLFVFGVVFGEAALHAQTVNLRGTISNNFGTAIPAAVVHVSGLNLRDTTGDDGNYSITQVVSSLPSYVASAARISLANGILKVYLAQPEPVKVEVFDIKSNLLKKDVMNPRVSGDYRWDLAKEYPTNQLLFVRTSIGKEVNSFRYVSLGNSRHVTHMADVSIVRRGIAKTGAGVDTLKVTADGYLPQIIALADYSMLELDVTLEIDPKICANQFYTLSIGWVQRPE